MATRPEAGPLYTFHFADATGMIRDTAHQTVLSTIGKERQKAAIARAPDEKLRKYWGRTLRHTLTRQGLKDAFTRTRHNHLDDYYTRATTSAVARTMTKQGALDGNVALRRKKINYSVEVAPADRLRAEELKLQELRALQTDGREVFSEVGGNLREEIFARVLKPMATRTISAKALTDELYAILKDRKNKKKVRKMLGNNRTIDDLIVDFRNQGEALRNSLNGKRAADLVASDVRILFASDTHSAVHAGREAPGNKFVNSIKYKLRGTSETPKVSAAAGAGAVAVVYGGVKVLSRASVHAFRIASVPVTGVAGTLVIGGTGGALGGAIRGWRNAGIEDAAAEIDRGRTKFNADGTIVEDQQKLKSRTVAAKHLLEGIIIEEKKDEHGIVVKTDVTVTDMLEDTETCKTDLIDWYVNAKSRLDVSDAVVKGVKKRRNLISYTPGEEIEQRSRLAEMLAQVKTVLVETDDIRNELNKRLTERIENMSKNLKSVEEQFKKQRRKNMLRAMGYGALAGAVGGTVARNIIRLFENTGGRELAVARTSTTTDTNTASRQAAATTQPDIVRPRVTRDRGGRIGPYDLDDLERTNKGDYIYPGQTLPTELKDELGDGRVKRFDPDTAAGATITEGTHIHPVGPAFTTEVPANTTWVQNPDGTYKLITPKGIVLMDRAQVGPTGMLPGVVPEPWEDIVKITTIPSGVHMFQPSAGTPEAAWRNFGITNYQQTWFANEPGYSDGTELQLTATREGGGVRLNPPYGIASSANETIDLSQLIATNQTSYGFFITTPEGTGLFVTAPQGMLLDPTNTTQLVHIITSDGSKLVSVAELTELVGNSSRLAELTQQYAPGQGVTTEGTGWENLFNANHIQAAQYVKSPVDGSITINTFATIHGDGTAKAFDLVDQTRLKVTVVDKQYYIIPKDVLEERRDFGPPPRETPAYDHAVMIGDEGQKDKDDNGLLENAGEYAAIALASGAALGGLFYAERRVAPRRKALHMIHATNQKFHIIADDKKNSIKGLVGTFLHSDEVQRAAKMGALNKYRAAELLGVAFIAQGLHDRSNLHENGTPYEPIPYRQFAEGDNQVDRRNLYQEILNRLNHRPQPNHTARVDFEEQNKILARRIINVIRSDDNIARQNRLGPLINSDDPDKRSAAIDVLISAFTTYEDDNLFKKATVPGWIGTPAAP